MNIDLQHGDCLELMENIPDGSIDMILVDPPYGTIKGMKLNGWKDGNQWDNVLPTDKLFKQYERILRPKGALVIFSQEPYTSKLRTANYYNLNFLYPMLWLKDYFANPFSTSKAPANYFEDISVFRKKYDRQLTSPVRKYSRQIKTTLGMTTRQICQHMGDRKLDHFLRCDSMQFSLPIESVYEQFTNEFNLKQYPWYLNYEQLKESANKMKPTFNIIGGGKSEQCY